MNEELCDNLNNFNREELETCSKEELIHKIKSLTAHNSQLKNILSKHNKPSNKPKQDKKIKDFDFSRYSFRQIALKFFYLGWDYNGYVVQEDTTETIEHYIFESLLKTKLIKDRPSSNYHRCGRTDKRVSSFGQVISIKVRSNLKPEIINNNVTEGEIEYCKVLNRILPDNIKCIGWGAVNDNFSARFDCKSRTYKYYFPKGILNIEKMRIASKKLLGVHDFRNFCKMDVSNGVTEFVRNIYEIYIEPFSVNTEEYGIYVISIRAKAFLWHQIRYILGILFLIGQEKEEPNLVSELLNIDKNPKKPDYTMASEIPLNLFFCEYDDIHWSYDKESLEKVIDQLNSTWTFLKIKETMVKDMIDNLKNIYKNEGGSLQKCLSDNLVTVSRKNYLPVLKRQTCNSLQEKIKHLSKRKKVEYKN